MPKQQIIPIWGGLNNANSPSATGLVDPVTGQQYNTGGLDRGDYFDLTEQQANSLSVTTIGLCHSGRYRWVQVDSGATAANVKTGTVGYLRAGTFMQNVVILTAGSGQTTGTYTVNANVGSGGGSGASITVVIAGGVITTVAVLNGGAGYVSLPTFTIAAGGTPGTVVAQLNTTMNTVTSADAALGTNLGGVGAVRPVVFLNPVTPGNYTFIQELGVATVLTKASQTQTVNQFAIVDNSSSNGLLTASSATYGPYAIGNVLDPITSPLVNTPVKVLLDGPIIQD